MRNSFSKFVNSLKKLSIDFDEISNDQKLHFLKVLSSINIPGGRILIIYFETLLFLSAYPPNEDILQLTENELTRISLFMKRIRNRKRVIYKSSGLPYSHTSSRFSHDFLSWLILNKKIKISINGFFNPVLDLNDVLKFTLPTLEISETTAGLSNDELFNALLVSKKQQLPFLLSQFSKLNALPGIKDQLFDSLDIYVNLQPANHSFSKSYNCLPKINVFFQKEIKKLFDHEKLIDSGIPEETLLSKSKHKEIIQVIKYSMALTIRETDPTVYMDEHSLRYYELERGISIAIYGMHAERQLPLESYVGYTLFKNGFPAAYGGSWVFGEHAHFGINIFETFRGGESGYMMCQLLRLYHHVFKVCCFEVEPYQFGLDNPEGIESGAFWFYYRYGFRPMNKVLLNIALREANKINTVKGYRTKTSILKQFTESNLLLKIKKSSPVKVVDITAKVKYMMKHTYYSDRLIAEKQCISLFKEKTKIKKHLAKNEMQVLKEVALWSVACQVTEKNKLDLLAQMIITKPKDLYKYQELLLQFFKN